MVGIDGDARSAGVAIDELGTEEVVIEALVSVGIVALDVGVVVVDDKISVDSVAS